MFTKLLVTEYHDIDFLAFTFLHLFNLSHSLYVLNVEVFYVFLNVYMPNLLKCR